jgi:uncharacterized glyoxalase superfamily protein PhnB
MSFDAIGIVSEEPKRSIEFFKILGIEIKQYEDSGHFEGISSSGVRIMLDTVEMIQSINPNWKKSPGGGPILCFKQATPEKVDELFKQLTQAGFKEVKEPWNAFWGHRYACILDPDGNQVDLFAPL